MNKLLNKKGETIVETLVAILIVAICFIMLQTSIISSARINKLSSEQNVPFVYTNDQGNVVGCSITINGVSVSSSYQCYKTTEGDYYYYE